ncbi:HD-GYP domain-containing protein [Desulfitispora alkaliphila]|uniref:HD-GYP domain-containing protein n=1 Tax=Desulfitispora alkaliphila TaxID=622674 RepID=UPI003D1A0C56
MDKIEPGVVLARPIYNDEGKILLAKGTTLKESYIEKLKGMKLSFLYVEDPYVGELDVEDVVSDQTRINATNITKKVMDTVIQGGKFELKPVQGIVDNILDEVLAASGLINLIDIRTNDTYVFAHSVNVAVLALMCGKGMGLNQLELKHLGIGALLHDVGMSKVDQNILMKKDTLDEAERKKVEEHCKLGFDVLKQYPEINLLASHCALQHHEKWDGTGYPRGLQENKIHLFAQITSIADVFDALTSDRPHRKRFQTYEAVEYLQANGGRLFNPELVEKFLQNIAVYPIGSLVKLNTGPKAVVVDVNKSFPTRPIVKLITDKTGGLLRRFDEIDLVKHNNVFIQEVLDQAIL